MAAAKKPAVKAGAVKPAAKKKTPAVKPVPRAVTLDVTRGDGCVVLTLDGKATEVTVDAAARASRELDRVLAEVR